MASPSSSYFRKKALYKRDLAEANYTIDPLDADNLTNWGTALLQLSWYQNGQDSKKMIEDAILKLQEALVIDPLKHDTLWLLGKCFTALKFHDPTEASDYLQKALACFQKASNEDPGNAVYFSSAQLLTKELEMDKGIPHTIAKMYQGILGIELDGMFTDAASSEAKDPEMDKVCHTNVEMGMDMDIDIETNASDQQFIDAASSKVKHVQPVHDQGASFDGELFQQQEVMRNSVHEQVASVAQGRGRRERKRKLTDLNSVE